MVVNTIFWLSHCLIETLEREDEDAVICVGFRYPSPRLQVSRYLPKLFRVGDVRPRPNGGACNVRPGPPEGFHGSRLQDPPGCLPRYPLDLFAVSSYKLGRLLGDSYPFMVLFSAAFALSL